MNDIKVCMDVETSGLEPGSRLVELAAIAFDDNGITSTFKQLINPGMPMPADASKLNGITDDMLGDMPDAGVVLKDFFAWLPSKTLVAHYAKYDTGVISWEAGRLSIKIPQDLLVICTCEIAKAAKDTKNNKLLTLVEHFNLEKTGDDHRAGSDADLCRQYFALMQKRGVHGNAVFWANAGHDYAYTDEFPPFLSNLPELVASGAPLSFSYIDAKGDSTERTISPYGWASVNNVLMIHGLCHMRKARRTFRADRMQLVKQEKAT